MKSFLQFNFLPRNPDLALLVLRLSLGGTMIYLHGWPKLQNLIAGKHDFADPLGIGTFPSLCLAVLAEALGSLMLILGWYGRIGALLLCSTMGVAFFVTHHHKLTGIGNGELAYVYLAGFVTVFLAGTGKFSVNPQG